MAHSTIQLASVLALSAALLSAAPAAAQAPYSAGATGTQITGPGQAAPVRDDLRWEEQRVPYDGGPIRPGAQLEGSVNGWTWLGVAGLVGGLGLSIGLAVANDRAYGAVPIVGPWLAVANVDGDRLQWEDSTIAGMVIAGILQPVGIAVMAIALANPNLYLVYDAPLGGPDGYARLRLAPFAPGAEAGLSLILEGM